MTGAIDRAVRTRAAGRCEYCHLPEQVSTFRHVLDHITAIKHHGPTESGNLALCCGHCNVHKAANLAGIDPSTGQITRLFNPRIDVWSDHFVYAGAEVIRRTPEGRTTIDVLNMNHAKQLEMRQSLIESGLVFGE